MSSAVMTLIALGMLAAFSSRRPMETTIGTSGTWRFSRSISSISSVLRVVGLLAGVLGLETPGELAGALVVVAAPWAREGAIPTRTEIATPAIAGSPILAIAGACLVGRVIISHLCEQRHHSRFLAEAGRE